VARVSSVNTQKSAFTLASQAPTESEDLIELNFYSSALKTQEDDAACDKNILSKLL
jgi:hypothetical protein